MGTEHRRWCAMHERGGLRALLPRVWASVWILWEEHIWKAVGVGGEQRAQRFDQCEVDHLGEVDLNTGADQADVLTAGRRDEWDSHVQPPFRLRDDNIP